MGELKKKNILFYEYRFGIVLRKDGYHMDRVKKTHSFSPVFLFTVIKINLKNTVE
jgi:hypothetical protein